MGRLLTGSVTARSQRGLVSDTLRWGIGREYKLLDCGPLSAIWHAGKATMTDYSRSDSHSSAPAGLMSLAVHVCVVMLLFTVLSNPVVQVKVKQAGRLFVPVIAAYLPEKTLQGGGGG